MKRKLLGVLLAVLMICSVFALTACDDLIGGGTTEPPTDETTDERIEQVYNLYVDYASSNGEVPKSYEEWLDEIAGKNGKDGLTPNIGYNGNWWIGNVDTGVPAIGKDGTDGKDGKDGISPHIGENGNWWVGNIDTGIAAKGESGSKGEDGITPQLRIVDGYWEVSYDNGENWISLGVAATGPEGDKEDPGENGENGEDLTTCKHEFSEWITDIAATCESIGVNNRTCSKCGEIEHNYTEKLEHSLIFVQDIVSTCTEHTVMMVCTECNSLQMKEVEALGHTYDDGNCTICGVTSDEYFVFTLLEDDTYSIKAKDINILPNTVTIPSNYEGKTITTIGSYAFLECTVVSEINIPNSIVKIENRAFYCCSDISSIVIPDSVKIIEDEAFCGCEKLSNITFSSNLTSLGHFVFDGTAYYQNEKNWIDGILYVNDILVKANHSISGNVTILNGTTTISSFAFKYCDNITGVVIPDSVTNIEYYAFHECDNLASIVIPNSVTLIDYHAFIGCNILSKMYYIGTEAEWNNIYINGTTMDGANGNNALINANRYYYSESAPTTEGNFWHWVNGEPIVWESGAISEPIATPDEYFIFTLLEDGTYSIKAKDVDNMPSEVVIPSTYNGKAVTYIEDSAFMNCASIESVIIPDGVTFISSSAFAYCTNLSNIDIPDSVTMMGYMVFAFSEKLTSIDLPDNLPIHGIMFYGCDLDSISVSSNNAAYYVEGNCLIEKETKKLVLGTNTSVIPDDVTSIEDAAFYHRTRLANITVPGSVTTIGINAFTECYGLTNLTIESGVTVIGNFAFSDCNNLVNITIPDSITFIDYTSFSNTAYYNDENNWANGVLYIGNHLVIADCDIVSGECVINDGTITVACGAFNECKSLASVVIPDSVVYICESAFSGCSSLTDVYYTGSEEDWAKISIGDYNSSLTNATIHYNYVPEE